MAISFNPLGPPFDFTGSGSSGPTVGAPVAGATPDSVLVTDNATNLASVGPLTDGQIIIGDTGSTPVAGTLSATANQTTITNGAGTITVGTVQDIGTTSTPTFTGLNANSAKITNVQDPTVAQDASTKNYVDTSISGLSAVYIPLTQKASNNGVATLDAGGKIPSSQLPNTVMEFKGNWDASTNTPTLIDGTGNAGDVYLVNVAGTQDLGSGSQTFAVGDWIVYSGTIWQKSINSNAVVSVNGQQGVVVLTTTDITEGTNLYFTNSRAQSAITGGASSIVTSNLTTNRALQSDGSGKVAISATTATELGFVSGVTSAIQTQINGKANTALSNLTATSINQALIPATTNNINLGSSTKTWNILDINEIKNVGIDSISVVSRELYDENPTISISWNTRQLFDDSAATSMEWNSRQLYDGAGNLMFDWATLGTIYVNNNTLTNVADPNAPQDAVTLSYLQANYEPTIITLPIAQGGTNSSATLNDNRIMVSSAGAIVESSALTDGQLLIGSTGGAPVPANLTAGTGISITNGGNTIIIASSTTSSNDLPEGIFGAANNQTSPADVTGFAFANASVRSFDALVSIALNATIPKYEVFRLLGVQTASNWSMVVSSTGDTSGIAFSITASGQVQYTSTNAAGFVSNNIHYRAITTAV